MPDQQQWLDTRFDDAFNFRALRPTQIFNLGAVADCGELFVGELRKRLLDKVSLLALTCGAGKTVLMLAFLYAICSEVNQRKPAAPRPRRVLWFVHQTELGRQLQLDLNNDIKQLRLVTTLPEMQICDQTGDLGRPPGQHDITISCPHALWESTNQSRSDAEIMALLAEYDVIIWDECDFARDQIGRLVRLSPHALKFGLTAAPIDADGNFIREFFVLAASAGHRFVFDDDKCLAPMRSWDGAQRFGYINPKKHGSHGKLWVGVEQLSSGSHGEKYSFPGSAGTVRQAIEDSIDLERRMRIDWPQHWYSPHILVPCNNIDEAIHLYDQTAHDVVVSGLSPDDGWYPTILVSAGTATKKQQQTLAKRPPVERRLFHKGGEIVHPFMQALTRQGRCFYGCSRIMFVVDIAIRGLNHWALKFVVDVKRSASWSEQVQTIGRMSRLPRHLREMIDDKFFDAYCHPRLYFPDYVDVKDDQCISAAQDAWNFILEMDSRLEKSGLLAWRDLLADEVPKQDDAIPVAATAPFTLIDQLRVDNALGALKADGKQITDEDINTIVQALPDPQSPVRTEAAKLHAQRVLTDKKYRDGLMMPKFDIIKPISREEPKNPADYTHEELASYIVQDPQLPNEYVSRLGDPVIRQIIGVMKNKSDQKHFRPVTKIRQLQKADDKPGVLTDFRDSLIGELRGLGLGYPQLVGPVSAAVNYAFALMCGAQDQPNPCENNGILDRPHYHYQLSIPSVRHTLKMLTLAQLIKKGLVGPAQQLYS